MFSIIFIDILKNISYLDIYSDPEGFDSNPVWKFIISEWNLILKLKNDIKKIDSYSNEYLDAHA